MKITSACIPDQENYMFPAEPVDDDPIVYICSLQYIPTLLVQ